MESLKKQVVLFIIVLFAFKLSFGQSAEDRTKLIELKTEAIDKVKTYRQLKLKETQFLSSAPKGSELIGYFHEQVNIESNYELLAPTTSKRRTASPSDRPKPLCYLSLVTGLLPGPCAPVLREIVRKVLEEDKAGSSKAA